MRKKYLLDTNICVALFRGLWDMANKVDSVGLENCSISDVTVAELWYGVECSSMHKKNADILEDFLKDIEIVPFEIAIREYAKERARLKKLGTPIDNFDLLIGCSAIATNRTLITDNLKHFERIEGLKLENWIDR